jgi:hypothetical protein
VSEQQGGGTMAEGILMITVDADDVTPMKINSAC